MELKYVKFIIGNKIIVRSNRTFMELKCQILINLRVNIESSNRTFMELKC